MSTLRVLFVVQGEGRGHLTQALALAPIFRNAGHEVTAVMVGTSRHRSIPRYFVDSIGAPVERFDSPTQVPDRDRRGLSTARTAWDATLRMPRFVRSGFRIHERSGGVDVVVNLLDIVAGISRAVLRTPVPAISIAHNYLFTAPDLVVPDERPGGLAAFRRYTGLTALRSRKCIALSFAERPPEGGLVFAPPLLRPGLSELRPTQGGYLLAYSLNAGYADDLIRWHARNPSVTVHCYLQGGGAVLGAEPSPGFHAHDLDQEAFLSHLAGCRAYVGSAGFESICEAFYLGKPVLAVPTKGQIEQRLNAWDAGRAGAARRGSYEDLDSFWTDPRAPDPARVQHFRDWVDSAPARFVQLVEEAVGERRRA